MSKAMTVGTCAECGKERGLYIPRLRLCRACHYARKLLRARRPNGPLVPGVGADPPRALCWCGKPGGAPYDGMCLRHWQDARRQPQAAPVYPEWWDWEKRS